MRVLIDERAVRALKRYLTTVGHECLTVQEVGWTGKQNGELLSLAEASFDRRLTLDTNLSCQQNLTGRKIAIVVLHSSSNRLDHPTSTLSRLFPACTLAIEKVRAGEIVQVGSST